MTEEQQGRRKRKRGRHHTQKNTAAASSAGVSFDSAGTKNLPVTAPSNKVSFNRSFVMTEEQQGRQKRKRGRHHTQKNTTAASSAGVSFDSAGTKNLPVTAPSNKISSESPSMEKTKARLLGGHFRMINEKLYTCTGDEALDYFKEEPAMFNKYHAGYQEQMSHWPEQPNDIIIKWIKDRGPSLVVTDFGCGDARIARSVKNKVFSIDLVSTDPSVIACDMSNEKLNSERQIERPELKPCLYKRR